MKEKKSEESSDKFITKALVCTQQHRTTPQRKIRRKDTLQRKNGGNHSLGKADEIRHQNVDGVKHDHEADEVSDSNGV